MQAVGVRTLFARVTLPLGFFAALLLLPEATQDPALSRVAPWAVIFMMLNLAPAMLSARPDLFAPPVLNGIVVAINMLSTLLGFFTIGELRMNVLGNYDTDQVADLAIKTLIIISLGTLSYYLGYYSRLGVSLRVLFPRMAGIAWERRSVIAVSMIPLVIFVVCYSVFQSRVGVSLFDVNELSSGKSVWREDATLSWMLRGVEIGSVPALFWFTWAASQRENRKLIMATVAYALVMLLVLRLGQRGPVAYGLLFTVIVFHYLKRRVPVSLFLAVYFAGIVASNIAYHWRVTDPETPRIETVSQVISDPVQVLTTHEKERQRFEVLAMVVGEFPATYDYLLGESWEPLITAVIPRWIWPEKVERYEWKDNRIIFKISGIPAPTPYVGALWANFSWLGVIIGGILFGMFHRGLYEWRGRDPLNPGTTLLYALISVVFQPGSLGFSALLQYVLPVWVLIRLMGRGKTPR